MPRPIKKFPLGSQKSEKTKILKHEQKLAKELGGRPTINSGSLDSDKGDVELKDFLLDSKETDKQAFRLDAVMLVKITREADGVGKKPGLVITIKDIAKTVASEWVLITKEDFKELLNGVRRRAES